MSRIIGTIVYLVSALYVGARLLLHEWRMNRQARQRRNEADWKEREELARVRWAKAVQEAKDRERML